MKSKEEIERLGNDYSDMVNHSKNLTSFSLSEAFQFGYTKSQEDNKDKKYTERQLREAISESWNSCEDNEDGETFTQVFDRIINSLNKP